MKLILPLSLARRRALPLLRSGVDAGDGNNRPRAPPVQEAGGLTPEPVRAAREAASAAASARAALRVRQLETGDGQDRLRNYIGEIT